MSDEAFHRRYDDQHTDDIDLPPRAHLRKTRGLVVFDTLLLVAGIAFVGTFPVRQWMPDVGGWRRAVLYAAGMAAVFALQVVAVQLREPGPGTAARRIAAPAAGMGACRDRGDRHPDRGRVAAPAAHRCASAAAGGGGRATAHLAVAHR